MSDDISAECFRERFKELLYFTPEHREAYLAGERRPDCTTLAKAAEAGDLSFLIWCVEEKGLAKEIDETTLGYAEKGGNVEVIAYIKQVLYGGN